MLTFEPIIAPALWLALLFVGAAACGIYAWRRPRTVPRQRWAAIIALMAVGMAVVLGILLNPTWVQPVPPPAGKPLLTVLVDSSASMTVRDAPGGQSRFQHAADTANRLAEAMADRFDVRFRAFSDSVVGIEPAALREMQPVGTSTDLARAIAESLEADRPQGHALLVLSDGIHNAAGGISSVLNVAEVSKAMNIPIWTYSIGGNAAISDVEVQVPHPQGFQFVGQTAHLSVSIRQRGALTNKVAVVLSSDAKDIERRDVPLPPNGKANLDFELRPPTSGLFRYGVRVEPVAGEATAANNRAAYLLRVVDQPIRVLLLEGKPYWDTKFLMRTLTADGSLDVDAVIKLAEGRFLKRTVHVAGRKPSAVSAGQPAPAASVQRSESTSIVPDPQSILDSPQGLEGYQIVVLGRDAEVFLSDAALERMRRWVALSGGSLVCFRGSPVAGVNQQLARLMPVHWAPGREARFRVRVTDRGHNVSWLGSSEFADDAGVLVRLPSLSAVASPTRPSPLAVVLASSEADTGQPVVTYQPYGSGRVAVIEGAGMWRWAFLAPNHKEEETIYSSLWQNFLRWLVAGVGLVPGQEMALRADKISYATNEAVTPVLLLREEARTKGVPLVELRRDGERSGRRVTAVPLGEEPGVFQIPFGKLAEGSYRASVVAEGTSSKSPSTTVAFDVRRFLGEQLDVAARPDLLGRLSNASGGQRLEKADARELAQRFSEYMARSRPPRFARTSAWDRWWTLAGIFCVWSATWMVRRRSGII